MTDLNPSPGSDGLRRKECISMAREICHHRGENPDAVDRQGNERWENYEPLAGACIREAERLFSLRASAQGTMNPVGWTAYCPTTGGRLFAYTELTARLEGKLIYAEHGFVVEPLYTAPALPSTSTPAQAPVNCGEPVAWMNSGHIEAYQSGKRDGMAWASPLESDFYSVALYAAPAPSQPDIGVLVSVKPMQLSDGRTDYFVSIKIGDREVTPHVFRDEQWKAEHEAATYRWLLLGADEPDILAYGPDGWPVRADLVRPAE